MAAAAELRAIFGWSTLKQVELYTRKADQRRLARGAMAKLVSKESGR